MRRISLLLPALIGLVSSCSNVATTPPAAPPIEGKVAMEWRFDTDGDFKGWSAGSEIADAAVSGGVLRGRAVGDDPILTGPVFGIQALPDHRVEVKMKATEESGAELFWTETLQGQYGGFSGEKHNTFTVQGDNQFHVYRVHPFWHAAGKIIRLRFDPPNRGAFEIESIRIVEEGAGAGSEAKAWGFDAGAQGWHAWQDMSEPVVRDGRMEVVVCGKSPILMSPPIRVSAEENPFVHIRMATEKGKMGRVFCVSSKQFGWEEMSFPLRSDGKTHSYNVDVGSMRKWRDEIVLLGIQPTEVEGAVAKIETIEIADGPRGPAELDIHYLGATDAIVRGGRPTGVMCCVANLGGEAARNVTATLVAPSRVKIVGSESIVIDKISLYLPKSATWRIEGAGAGDADVSVRLEGEGIKPVTAKATLHFTKAPDAPKASCVPEPIPVKSKYEIGVFYFPGWSTMSRWRPIFDFPERKPVLGWYDEANPECADWQIKWAVEHGVNFFMLDWYWCQGGRHLEHWLHDAYMKSKYRKYLKWAIMWANHNAPKTHSLEDWRAVTKYWIDNYFAMPEYYRIDDRPAVFIWAPQNIRRDLGGSEQAAKLYALSQQMAREAGYKGLYFVSMSAHETEAQVKELKAEGYEAFTSYHGFGPAIKRGGGKYCDYADVVETSPQLWKERDERASGLLQMPIADTGWSSEPWHHAKAMVISGRTPELFGKLCRLARDYADKTGKKIIAIGPWNEWGEGSYIEPYAQYGFQDLDQLREAFCGPGKYPPNLIPSDVGLGPYDLAPMAQKTSWEFNTDGDSEGWMPNGAAKVEVKGGALQGESAGTDPILSGPAVEIEAETCKRLVVRMSSSADDRPQFFWGTTLLPASEASSARFDVPGDGKFHDYTIDLSQCRRWRGVIVSLRLDPASKPGVKFAIDSIRLMKE